MANPAQTAARSKIEQVSLPARSMYLATPIYRLGAPDETLVFGLRVPVLGEASGDVNLTVTAPLANRLDLIAQQLLGQSNAWWAIADVSGLIDPLAGVSAGTVLRAPALGRLPV